MSDRGSLRLWRTTDQICEECREHREVPQFALDSPSIGLLEDWNFGEEPIGAGACGPLAFARSDDAAVSCEHDQVSLRPRLRNRMRVIGQLAEQQREDDRRR